LEESFRVVSLPLSSSRKIIDYRQKHLEEDQRVTSESSQNSSLESSELLKIFFSESHDSQNAYHRFEDLFHKLAGDNLSQNALMPIETYSRSLQIPCSSNSAKVARFNFSQLCSENLSSVDYNSLAKNYPIVFIEQIPQLSVSLKNETRRFITLIDEFYNHNSVLVCHSKVKLDDLFSNLPVNQSDAQAILESLQFERSDDYGKRKKDLTQFSGKNEAFAFARALSRLREFQTRRYLQNYPQVIDNCK
jgi:protein AFG1